MAVNQVQAKQHNMSQSAGAVASTKPLKIEPAMAKIASAATAATSSNPKVSIKK